MNSVHHTLAHDKWKLNKRIITFLKWFSNHHCAPAMHRSHEAPTNTGSVEYCTRFFLFNIRAYRISQAQFFGNWLGLTYNQHRTVLELAMASQRTGVAIVHSRQRLRVANLLSLSLDAEAFCLDTISVYNHDVNEQILKHFIRRRCQLSYL